MIFTRAGNSGGMTTTTLITVNASLSLLVILAVAAVVRLAHRLPSSAPHHDETWGKTGDPWVASEPLPLLQVAHHESSRAEALAA